jgi:hypothetical protein
MLKKGVRIENQQSKKAVAKRLCKVCLLFSPFLHFSETLHLLLVFLIVLEALVSTGVIYDLLAAFHFPKIIYNLFA